MTRQVTIGESNRRIVDVYANIYRDRYAMAPASLDIAREIVAGDLASIGLSPGASARMAAFNVGTGIEAVALLEFGFDEVFHVDLSPLAVQALTQLRNRDAKFAGLHTFVGDLCATSLPFERRLDCIYLNGVLHHLHDPRAAVECLTRHANPGATFFARIYRSGSLLFFVVDFVRRFVGYADRQALLAAAAVVDGSDVPPAFASEMWDDFLVPVLRLYDIRKLTDYFRGMGWRTLLDARQSAPDHSDPSDTPELTAVAFERVMDRDRDMLPFPPHQDQVQDGLVADDVDIRSTANLMIRALQKLGAASAPDRLATAVQIYHIARRTTGESALERHRLRRSSLTGWV